MCVCSSGLSDHIEAIDRLQKVGKSASRQLRNQLREIAQLLAFQHLHSDPVDCVACIHRDDGDVEFMNIVANQLMCHVSVHEHVSNQLMCHMSVHEHVSNQLMSRPIS